MEVVLDACAYRWSPGQILRVSVAGTDWPNTVAPPHPVTLTVHGVELELPVLDGDWPAPSFCPGAEHSAESAEGVGWEMRDDVLRRTTSAAPASEYDTPYDGAARRTTSARSASTGARSPSTPTPTRPTS